MMRFRRLVVLLENQTPEAGAFALAVDWACRLHLPILGVSWQDLKSAAEQAGPETGMSEVEKTCGELCARRNIPWQVFCWRGPFGVHSRRLIQPADLLISGRGFPPVLKNYLLRQVNQGWSLLLCPENYHPVTRILFVQEGEVEWRELLRITADLCQLFRAGLVVLTVAGTEDDARQRQNQAQEALKGLPLVTDFDFLVGGDSRSVLASVARWRRCQLVVTAPPENPRWWRWWRSDSRETEFIALSDSLAFLTLAGNRNKSRSLEPIETAPVRPHHSLLPGKPSFRERLVSGDR